MLKFIVKKMLFLLSLPAVREVLLEVAADLAKRTANPYDDAIVKELGTLCNKAKAFGGDNAD